MAGREKGALGFLRSRRARAAMLAALVALVPVAGRGDAMSDDAILDPVTGRRIGESELISRLAEADFVLLGELHDNPEHHRLQAWVVAALASSGHPPAAVLFEMIDLDQQEAIDRHLGQVPVDTRTLGEVLAWEERGWPGWAMYRPIVDAALAAGAEVLAANLPRAEIRPVYATGMPQNGITGAARAALLEPLPDEALRSLRDELERSHCDELAAAQVEAMVRVQRARDAVMADRLVRSACGGPVILIAGAGHARTDRGVPWYLKRLVPDAEVVSLAFAQRSGNAPDGPGVPYDVLWLTEPGGRTVEEACGRAGREHRPGDE